jgi:hypothetical protein
MKKLLLAAILLITATPIISQTYKPSDKEIFDNYIQSFKSKSELPFYQLVTQTALFFLGTPYVAHTLEKEPEQLVVNLDELDCTTFVETVLALANTIRSKTHTFDNFCHYLQTIRYRDGIIDRYPSRLHYTTEWAADNQKKGLVNNITRENGGTLHNIEVNIISSNPHRFKQLQNNPSFIPEIRKTEQEISSGHYYYIPREEIESHKEEFQSGDIIGFVTETEGLDITHMAFIYKEPAKNNKSERLTFIHASSGKMKVVVEELTLSQYALKTKKNKGIIVLRPL